MVQGLRYGMAMKLICRKCNPEEEILSERQTLIVRFGYFYRKSDKKYIPRYLCMSCKSTFSKASFDLCYRQKRRDVNNLLAHLLASGVSQRRASKILLVNKNTVARKFVFMGCVTGSLLRNYNLRRPKAHTMEFDDMESYEHTKCKPLSITIAVEQGSRRILGFAVARMPAKGKIAHRAREKYGVRADERSSARERLFDELKPLVQEQALIKSDQNPHYPSDVRRHFPKASHKSYEGRKPLSVGQGELKKGGFDPLFSLNHTFAKIRGDVNRLFRKTWCTTKSPAMLHLHLNIQAYFHNMYLEM